MSDEDDDALAKSHQAFLKQRDDWHRLQAEQKAALDKSVFIVSTGFFGISFVFSTEAMKTSSPLARTLLVCSWAMVASSILLQLASYYFVFFAYAKRVSNIDEACKRGNYQLDAHPRPLSEIISRCCEYSGIALLLIGIISFFAVVIMSSL